LITLSSSTGASRPRAPISSGEGICAPQDLNLFGQLFPVWALTGKGGARL
jgi:hypothetical protein